MARTSRTEKPARPGSDEARTDEARGLNVNRLALSLALVLTLALVGAGLVLLFDGMAGHRAAAPHLAGAAAHPPLEPSTVHFDPPRPEDAPADIRDAVMLGYNVLMETHTYAGEYVGNDLQCRSCHFNAGREVRTLSLVGVAAKYPKYRKRQDFAADLVTRTQGCFQRSMNGRPLPPDGDLMQGLMAYYHWISKGVPIYADIPWLGLEKLDSSIEPDPAAGAAVYVRVCARCHGGDGQGTDIAPPVWGPRSFNDGAGMNEVANLSSFAHHFMPKGDPQLGVEEARDVAAFISRQPRPRFSSGS